MTCLYPWDIAEMPDDGMTTFMCSRCKGIYRASVDNPECPKVFIKCKEARQVPTARKVG